MAEHNNADAMLLKLFNECGGSLDMEKARIESIVAKHCSTSPPPPPPRTEEAKQGEGVAAIESKLCFDEGDAARLLEMKEKRAKFLKDNGLIRSKLLANPKFYESMSFLEEADKTMLKNKGEALQANDGKASARLGEMNIDGRLNPTGPTHGGVPANNLQHNMGLHNQAHAGGGGGGSAPIDLAAVNSQQESLQNVFEACALDKGRKANSMADDRVTASLAPLLELSPHAHTLRMFKTTQLSSQFEVEMSLKDEFTSNLLVSSSKVTAEVKSSAFFVTTSVSHEQGWSKETTSSNSDSTFKYTAKFVSPCCIFDLESAIKDGAVSITPEAYLDLQQLLNKTKVLPKDVKEFVNKYGETFPSLVIIGVAATAVSEKVLKSSTNLTTEKSSMKTKVEVGVKVGGFGGSVGNGFARDSESGKREDHAETTERLSWTANAGVALTRDDPRTIADYRCDANSWRSIEYARTMQTMDVIVRLCGTDGMVCRLALGHLMPFQHTFHYHDGKYSAKYIGTFLMRSDPPVPHGRGSMILEDGAVHLQGDWVEGKLQGEGSVLFFRENYERKFDVVWHDSGVSEVRNDDLLPHWALSLVPHRVHYANGDCYVGTLLATAEYKELLDNAAGNKKGPAPTASCCVIAECTRHGSGVYTCACGAKYDGEWKDGKMHGRGVRTYANGHKYDGEWKDDKKNGSGVYTFANGDKYDGQWKDGKKHGEGVLTCACGDKYDGAWKDGKENGRGVRTLANGHKYDGEWKDGDMHGRGVYTFANGAKYDGQWKDGKKHGEGVLTCACGDQYDGQWKDGKKHGEGVLTCACGAKYDGAWKDGKENGSGVLTYADGYKYDGQWRDGKKNGRGVLTSADGAKYDGEWKDGKMHGKGVWTYANGAQYDGEWVDGKENGKGVLTYADGDNYDEGEWENDESLT